MSYVVVATIGGFATPEMSTPVENLVLNAPPPLPAAQNRTRQVSLNEEVSGQICVRVSANGTIRRVTLTLPPPPLDEPTITAICAALNSVPFGPKAALLGTYDPATNVPTPLLWFSDITEAPMRGDTEVWEIFNFTVDSHPIHVHLVDFDVVDRQAFDPLTGALGLVRPPEANELGPKDTVIAYPGEVTRIRALFDIAGLYVWHCHILSHEDNEMMRPFCVKTRNNQTSCPAPTPVPIVPGA
jgi:FtsP/CotA-like multicopper oxidase with cupredoxin domain